MVMGGHDGTNVLLSPRDPDVGCASSDDEPASAEPLFKKAKVWDDLKGVRLFVNGLFGLCLGTPVRERYEQDSS